MCLKSCWVLYGTQVNPWTKILHGVAHQIACLAKTAVNNYMDFKPPTETRAGNGWKLRWVDSFIFAFATNVFHFLAHFQTAVVREEKCCNLVAI